MAEVMYETTWGSLRLFCVEMETDRGRTVVVHDLTSGDVHPTQNRGRHAGRVKCKLAFDDFPGFPPPLKAARALDEAVGTGKSAMFSHPMLGAFMAQVGEFTLHQDESDNLTADAEFIPDDAVPPISPAGPGASGEAGEQAVSAAADEFDKSTQVMTDEEIRDILEDDTGKSISDDARESVASWGVPEDPPTRQVLIDTARLSDRIALAIEVGRFEDDLALFPCYRASIMLGSAIRAAAIAVTSEAPTTFIMRVVDSTALLPLCARVYGGADAFDRARQVASLNDISSPAWLTPGDYLFPARTVAQRSPF